jgi:hypothetical protein
MTLGQTLKRMAAPVLLVAAFQSSVFAQDNTDVLPAQLPPRNPVNLNSRQLSPVQGPGAFTTADASTTSCDSCQSPTFWQRCRGRWVVCKDNWHRHFIGDDGSTVLPLGTLVDGPFQIQIANAEAACMCLHRYDFKDGTSQLNDRGQAQLTKILTLLPKNFAPVTVEATGVPQVDDARRMSVYRQLSTSTFPIPLERVVCGPTTATGIAGSEAEVVNQNLMDNMKQKGNTSTTAGMSFSSSGGSGH